jgi:hypothetical protein
MLAIIHVLEAEDAFCAEFHGNHPQVMQIGILTRATRMMIRCRATPHDGMHGHEWVQVSKSVLSPALRFSGI